MALLWSVVMLACLKKHLWKGRLIHTEYQITEIQLPQNAITTQEAKMYINRARIKCFNLYFK